MSSSKKGISAHQLHRTLEVTYKTAWFLAHRFREAKREWNVTGGMGGSSKVVEADETYIGGKWKNDCATKPLPEKESVVSLVEQDGKVRSFHVEKVNAPTFCPILVTHINRASASMTDEARVYKNMGKEFNYHGTVNHLINEYVCCSGFIHTNRVEGYFSILKRGITGIYQHCSPQHLKRYLCDFDFRYNERHVTDMERTGKALEGI